MKILDFFSQYRRDSFLESNAILFSTENRNIVETINLLLILTLKQQNMQSPYFSTCLPCEENGLLGKCLRKWYILRVLKIGTRSKHTGSSQD